MNMVLKMKPNQKIEKQKGHPTLASNYSRISRTFVLPTPVGTMCMCYFHSILNIAFQPTFHGTGWKKNVHEQDMEAIENFNAERTCYWLAMIDVSIVGPGFIATASEVGRIDLLVEVMQDMEDILQCIHDSWRKTGCTIMPNGWTDKRNKILLDFLVA
jgi:hypothetical protein